MPSAPQWDSLYEIAAGQHGLFTTQQAEKAGYSPQLLVHHLHSGKATRVRRGIYRLVHFPASEHDDLVTAWLWSEQRAVVSHQTALALHGLSDVLPAQIHLTVPSAWRRRRLRIPVGVLLHYADLPAEDRDWFEAVPVTRPRRTLSDCANDALSPELLRRASQQALRRGLVARGELGEVEKALSQFGGIGS